MTNRRKERFPAERPCFDIGVARCDIMLSMEAFLLGLSNGVVCIGYCAPILVPYLLGQGSGVLANVSIVARFLLGRLAGYLAFSVLAFAFHTALPASVAVRNLVMGSTYVILSVLLVFYGFRYGTGSPVCAARGSGPFLLKAGRLWPALAPAILGLLTGLTICPPFLLAFTAAVEKTTLTGSVAFFVLFFCGTSVFFLPFPLVGSLKRLSVLSTVGRLAAGIVGLYYFYAGLMLLLGVIKYP